MNKTIIMSIVFLTLFLGVSCGNNTSEHNHEEKKRKKEITNQDVHNEEPAGILNLQFKQLEVMKIETGMVEKVTIGTSLKVNGQLELPPQKQASVSAIIDGKVNNVLVIEGDKVRKGQVLAWLSNPDLISMQRDYLLAKDKLLFLEKDYNRKKELLADGITSAKVFQKTESDYFEGKTMLRATRANLRLMGISISNLEQGKIVSSIPVVAPIKGYIQKVEVNMGKYVLSNQELFEIVDNEHLHLGLKVFEKDIDKVKLKQKVSFSLTTRPNQIYEAKIFALGRSFEMDTRAVKVHAEIIGGHQGLLTGMFVDARIILNSKDVEALPNEAFISEDGLDYVFIQKEKDAEDASFEKIQVNKGITDLGFSEVIFPEKVPKDAIFVTKGAYYINAELNKGAFEEHEH
jgi:cobalt-zinc-cadmium efflux system membrane fusion protein